MGGVCDTHNLVRLGSNIDYADTLIKSFFFDLFCTIRFPGPSLAIEDPHVKRRIKVIPSGLQEKTSSI